MRSLVIITCIVAAGALLAPGTGSAAITPNQIGIYTEATGGNAYINPVAPMVPVNLYFVVNKPMYPNGSGPMPSIDAFEFKVRVTPASSWFRLAEIMPTGSINVGYGFNYDAGTADYAVGWPTPLPVVNGTVSVMMWNVMFLGSGPYEFYLGPAAIATVPGYMVVNCPGVARDYLAACTPSSDSFARPVFAAGLGIVGTQQDTFGGVKALFR